MLAVAETNAAQLDIWNGDSGAFWAAHADTIERTLEACDGPLLASLTATDRVLDVGCGTGATTRAAAGRAHLGKVLGVDLSAGMLAEARRRAAHLPNVAFTQADAQAHRFTLSDPAGFDAVISRTGTLYFGDPPAAFANLRRALRPGGRLAMLVWQELSQNPWLQLVHTAYAAPPPPPGTGPFSLSDPAQTRELLERAGFTGVAGAEVRRPMWFGPTADDARALLSGLAGWLLAGRPPAAIAAANRALREALVEHGTPAGVLLPAATWLITARATP